MLSSIEVALSNLNKIDPADGLTRLREANAELNRIRTAESKNEADIKALTRTLGTLSAGTPDSVAAAAALLDGRDVLTAAPSPDALRERIVAMKAARKGFSIAQADARSEIRSCEDALRSPGLGAIAPVIDELETAAKRAALEFISVYADVRAIYRATRESRANPLYDRLFDVAKQIDLKQLATLDVAASDDVLKLLDAMKKAEGESSAA